MIAKNSKDLIRLLESVSLAREVVDVNNIKVVSHPKFPNYIYVEQSQTLHITRTIENIEH